MCGAAHADTSANKMQMDEIVSEGDAGVEEGYWELAVVVRERGVGGGLRGLSNKVQCDSQISTSSLTVQ